MEKIKDTLAIIQSILTIVTIVAAAVWFIYQREAFPKINVTHAVTHRKIHDDWIWVCASIQLANAGKRVVVLNSGTIALQKIMPLDRALNDKLNNDGNLLSGDQSQVPWPTLKIHKNIEVHIEPGETETVSYDFIVPSYIKTIRLYSFFQKQGSEIGWHLSSIEDLQ